MMRAMKGMRERSRRADAAGAVKQLEARYAYEVATDVRRDRSRAASRERNGRTRYRNALIDRGTQTSSSCFWDRMPVPRTRLDSHYR